MQEQLHAHPAPLPSVVERKLFLWLIAPVALITFVNSIDRVNVSYAGSAMSADLGLSPSQFGQGVSMFFVAYLLFQYPHVRLLRAWGIKPWIFVSMLLWGLSGLWMSQIETAAEFYAARFLLGMAEAGFAPGMTWLISRWAPPSIRARALAGALVAVPLSMVLGGPLCGWLMGVTNPLDMPGWRWMLLIEGVVTVLMAAAGVVLVLYVLSIGPAYRFTMLGSLKRRTFQTIYTPLIIPMSHSLKYNELVGWYCELWMPADDFYPETLR